MDSDFRSLLSKLEQISKKEVSNIFNGTGESGSRICQLCFDISRAVDAFLDPNLSVDWTESESISFLRSSLPIFIEILIRRTTLRWVTTNSSMGAVILENSI